MSDGVLRIATTQAINVWRISAACKKGVVMARGPTYTGTGIITANSSATGNTTAIRIASIRLLLPKTSLACEVACDPCNGTSCESCLIPKLLRLRGPTLDAKTIKTRTFLEVPSSGHRDEADRTKALFGPTAAVQITGGQAKEPINETCTKVLAMGVS